MKLRDVLTQLQETSLSEENAALWDESVSTCPEGLLPFLRPEQIQVGREWGGIDEAKQATLEEGAKRIAADPALRLMAWHAYRLLFETEEKVPFHEWPSFEHSLGDLRGCFYLLVGLAMVPAVREKHAALGVADDVTRDTCSQLRCFSENYHRGNGGLLGAYRSQMFWLRGYAMGSLFRLGRFEYRLQPIPPRVHVYRHCRDGLTLALAEDGMEFTRDGYVNGAGGLNDDEPWTASLEATETEVAGFPIAPTGVAINRHVALPLADWERVVRPGDYTLDMHIPAGGSMSLDRCIDSMRQAVDFFRQTFPEKPFRSFYCHSWIFGPQLEGILPDEGNLVQYLRRLYLFPVPCPHHAGLWFVFLCDNTDPATLPRETSVQRAIVDYLAAGKTWREGGMTFLVDDLDSLDGAPYRRGWPEIEKRLMLD
jgi:GNAT-like C-terminal domain/N-acyltransferase N-terminal domain